MQIIKLWAVMSLALIISGCSNTPSEQKDEAEAIYIEQKTETVDEYKKCINDADHDAAKMDTCERLLKAVPGLTPAAASDESPAEVSQ